MKKVIKFLFVVERKLRAEDGSTIVLALFILVLLAAFVTLAITRSVNETVATTNDAAETRAFAAAEASLEVMTRTFKKIFDEKLAPEPPDLLRVQNTSPLNFSPSEFSDYTFEQLVRQTGESRIVDIGGGTWKGLKALRDEWMFQTTATDTTGVQVALRRWFFNNRIPLFQFGVFYNDDVEFHPGPRFDFGGRVHTNGNIFLMAGAGLYFSSKVSASGRVITDVARNGTSWNHWGDPVYIKDASGTYVRLRYCMGSVLTQSYSSDCNSPVSGPPVFDPNYPTLRQNDNWNTYKALFQGNLEDLAPRLDLPIARELGVLSYIQLIKRGKEIGDLHNQGGSIVPVNSTTADSIIVKKERYTNKVGIRITLADRKEMLPGCADPVTGNAVATPCGVRLDGDPSGNGLDGPNPENAGYLPKPMADGYQATRVNGYRLRTGGTSINGRPRQVWIKIELVFGVNPVTGRVDTQDVTEHILSLGVTERPDFASIIQGYGNADSRSIVKIQRFSIPGVQIHASDNLYYTFLPSSSPVSITNPGPLANHNIVALRYSTDGSTWTGLDTGYSPLDGSVHCKIVNLPSGNSAKKLEIVPFPIEMFDAREGLFNDNLSSTTLNSLYPNGTVPWAGVMSMIDIDIANLRRFLKGDFDSMMPTIGGRRITSANVPSANGWVLYVSDRRGDRDFDGQYDMENVYVRTDSSGRPLESGSDLTLEPGEDVNNNGVLDVSGFNTGEAPRYADRDNNFPYCAFFDHGYYRRGVRLINGTTLPGQLDLTNPANTRGFTVASENAVYVKGNYNATGITAMGDPTPPQNYLPQNTPEHIPASIIADAVVILSNAWQDSRSFRYPFSLSNRVASETTIRFAMIAGDPISSLNGNPNQGGGDPRLAGGVHNFKRFLEYWGGNAAPLHYTGSIINLYNSQVNNGSFKCCSKVYSPPRRDWTFDVSFLDPTRLPPGTPFAHDIQLTGFQRVN